ncbi:MAG TPA: type II secretion system secretin GspD [Xanthobacteraceae bacterium]|nr:type II secretion system secretin GspD [Xanthobacteraceae bacterium]
MRLRACLFYWRRISWLCVGGVLIVSLVACSNPRLDKSIPEPDAVDPARSVDFSARYPLATNPQAGGSGAPSRYLVVPGMDGQLPMGGTRGADAGGSSAVASTDGGAGTAAGGIEINLDGADIQTAAKTLLGDTLHLNFVVDPRVQGTVTVASVGPVDRRQVFPIFESVLRMSNAALVREGDIVKIVPAPEAAGSGVISVGVGPPGFGVSVVPLRYASATAVAKLAENFLTRPGALRADQNENLVLIQGTTSERQAAVDVIAGLDAEWLRNQSVGLYPLKSTQPETMIQELDRIFGTKDGGAEQGAVQFQPISRLNAVMAVTKSPRLLQRVTQWVERLDRADGNGESLRLYRLQNGDSRQVAKIMNDLFVNRSGAGETPSSQLAPGTATAQSRLDSLNSSSSSGLGSSSSSSGSQAGGTGTGTGGTSGGLQAAASKSPFEGFAGANQDNDQNSASLSAGNMPRGLFQNVRITADTANNSILVYSNLEDYRVIEHALQQLDQPKLQVAIEATVAEVTLTDQLQYGVQNYLTSANLGMGGDKGSIGLFPGATSPLATTSTATATTTGGAVSSAIANQLLSRVLPGFNLLLGSEAQPSLVLSALSTLTEVKVLSSPSVVALDNQPAMILVGQDVPITTSSATVLTAQNTVVNTIDMRSTGIILKILPHVHANGTVQLEIEQEISNVVNPNSTAAQNLTPTISERRIHSTIVMANGQTAMIGGLISDQQDNSKAGLPGLNHIQYLGDILSTLSKDRQRQEIIMFITPKVIGNGVDMQAISNEFRARLHSLHSETGSR